MLPALDITQRRHWVIALLLAAGAIGWGLLADGRPVPPLPPLPAVPADSAWYAMLPRDPDLATQAYLARIPPALAAVGRSRETAGIIAVVGQLLALGVAFGLVAVHLRRRPELGADPGTRRHALRDAWRAAQFLTLVFLLELPVDTYVGFVRARALGIYHAPFATWLHDQAMGWVVLTIFTTVGIVVILQFIRRAPRRWPWLAPFAYAVLVLTYNLLLPGVIEPRFGRMVPLPEGPAREAILSLAQSNGVPAAGVYVQDVSSRSELLDAHVSGIAGKARIVLSNNALTRAPLPAIRAVVGHEIGHYVMDHQLLIVVFRTLMAFAGFLVIALLLRRLEPEGDRRRGSRPWLVPIVWWGFATWGVVTLPITNTFFRRLEYQADLYGLNAARAPLGFGDYFLVNAGAGDPAPSRMMELLFHDHPAADRRIHAAMVWRAAQPPCSPSSPGGTSCRSPSGPY